MRQVKIWRRRGKGGTGGEVDVARELGGRERKKEPPDLCHLSFFNLCFFSTWLISLLFVLISTLHFILSLYHCPHPSLRPSLCRRWRVCGWRRLLKHGRRRLIIDGVFSSMQAGQRAAPTHSHASGPADSLSGALRHAQTHTQTHIHTCRHTHTRAHRNKYKGKQRCTHITVAHS